VVLVFDAGLAVQVVAFAIFAAASIAVGLRLRGAKHVHVVNTAQSGLLGRPARVLQVDGAVLRVRIGDSDWPARLARDVEAPEVGINLRVVGVDGMTVVVGRADG
jgi:membrane protein implicated in regulation of membrane protease activity